MSDLSPRKLSTDAFTVISGGDASGHHDVHRNIQGMPRHPTLVRASDQCWCRVSITSLLKLDAFPRAEFVDLLQNGIELRMIGFKDISSRPRVLVNYLG